MGRTTVPWVFAAASLAGIATSGCGGEAEAARVSSVQISVASSMKDRVLAIQSARDHGLDPAMYGLSELSDGLPTSASEGSPEWARADSVLNDGVDRLKRDLLHGAAPRALHDEHPDDSDDSAAATTLDEVMPAGEEYDRLVGWLAVYREAVEQGGWGTVPGVDESLEPGMSGGVVPALRDRLLKSVDAVEREKAERSRADGSTYGPELAGAVAHFQERHGLEPDSVVGKKTVAALNIGARDKVGRLATTLERWRWMPRDFGEHGVWVNIPSFELVVMDHGTQKIHMPVVVGAPGWETPTMSHTLQTLVVNPYWNVPVSILEDEVLPAQQRNPDYLVSRNYEVVGPGEDVLPATSVDWQSVTAESFPYRIRQRPGAGNALGKVKFLFPNKDNIYLHDTPADALFGQAQRAFSHGCIRVARPKELAMVLGAMGGVDTKDLEAAFRSDKNRSFRLGGEIPVHLTYLTVRAPDDGAPRFYDDVYGRERPVAAVVAQQ